MILALGALLASAFLADTLSRDLPSLVLRPESNAEHVAERMLRASAGHSGAQRLALVRSTGAAIVRQKASNGDSGDQRPGDMLVVPVERFERTALRTPGAAVLARSHGVAPPGQPAPSSRAPPVG